MNNVFDIRTGRAVYKTPFLNLSKFLISGHSTMVETKYSEYTDGSNFFAGQNTDSSTAFSGWC